MFRSETSCFLHNDPFLKKTLTEGSNTHGRGTHKGTPQAVSKKYQLVETDLELPIQGQVKDPEDLYLFLKDLQDENVSKVIGGKRDLPRFNVRIRPKADTQGRVFPSVYQRV